MVQSKTVWGGCPGIGGVAGNVVVQTDTHALLMAPPSLLMCISPPHCSRSTFMPVVGSIEFVMGLLKKCKLRQHYLVARSDFSSSKELASFEVMRPQKDIQILNCAPQL